MPEVKMRTIISCIILLPLILGCGGVAKIMGKKDEPVPVYQGQEEFTVINPESSYHWAVQAFEAGNYEQSLEQLRVLQADGPASNKFQEVPYYLGMSYYYLLDYDKAADSLEQYVSYPKTGKYHIQGLIALLEIFLKQRKWDSVSLRAAELNQKSMLPGYRLLLSLIWAEALTELGELASAESLIQKAEKILLQVPRGSAIGGTHISSFTGLQERLLWLRNHHALRSCALQAPPKLNSNSRKQRIYSLSTWYKNNSECYKNAMQKSLRSFASLGPYWLHSLEQSIQSSLDKAVETPKRLAETTPKLTATEVWELSKEPIHSILYFMTEQTAVSGNHITSSQKQVRDHLHRRAEELLQKLALESATKDRAL